MEDELCDLIEAPSLGQAEQPRNLNFQKKSMSVGETVTFTLQKRTSLIFILTASQEDIYSPNNSSFLVLEL